jgi:hypothetical protein
MYGAYAIVLLSIVSSVLAIQISLCQDGCYPPGKEPRWVPSGRQVCNRERKDLGERKEFDQRAKLKPNECETQNDGIYFPSAEVNLPESAYSYSSRRVVTDASDPEKFIVEFHNNTDCSSLLVSLPSCKNGQCCDKFGSFSVTSKSDHSNVHKYSAVVPNEDIPEEPIDLAAAAVIVVACIALGSIVTFVVAFAIVFTILRKRRKHEVYKTSQDDASVSNLL